MSATTVSGGAVWWTLTRQAWCLQVKLCDPYLSALSVNLQCSEDAVSIHLPVYIAPIKISWCSSSEHLMQVKLLLVFFIWMADCVQFLSENRLNGCQIFGRFGFQKPNPNRILVFSTLLSMTCDPRSFDPWPIWPAEQFTHWPMTHMTFDPWPSHSHWSFRRHTVQIHIFLFIYYVIIRFHYKRFI